MSGQGDVIREALHHDDVVPDDLFRRALAALDALEQERDDEQAHATYAIEAMEHATIRAVAAEKETATLRAQLEFYAADGL